MCIKNKVAALTALILVGCNQPTPSTKLKVEDQPLAKFNITKDDKVIKPIMYVGREQDIVYTDHPYMNPISYVRYKRTTDKGILYQNYLILKTKQRPKLDSLNIYSPSSDCYKKLEVVYRKEGDELFTWYVHIACKPTQVVVADFTGLHKYVFTE